jgi:hypothetical protein
VDTATVNRVVALLIGVVVCLFCSIRAVRAEQRSRRLALTGLACAVAVLPLVAGAFLTGSVDKPLAFIVAGILCVLAGMTAVLFALRAKAAKAKDGGTGNVTPAAALVLGVAGSLFGLWLIALPASRP